MVEMSYILDGSVVVTKDRRSFVEVSLVQLTVCT